MTAKPIALLLTAAILALAACGADGDPERPTRADLPTPGVSISGTVEFGVQGSN